MSTSNVERAGREVAKAIAPDALPGTDAQGGTVTSLTEAVMGVTAALTSIADALHRIAAAVEERDS